MARIVNEQGYAARRNAILDVAQRLVYTRGYEQMAIQDVLDELRISKGAFYHYFDSKPALLEALIERMQQEALELLNPIVQDPHLPTLEKLQRFFDTAVQWPEVVGDDEQELDTSDRPDLPSRHSGRRVEYLVPRSGWYCFLVAHTRLWRCLCRVTAGA